MSKNNNMSILLKGIIIENPVLVLVLGTYRCIQYGTCRDGCAYLL